MDRPDAPSATDPSLPPEQELEEARIGHGIPTVRPLRDDELPTEPPPRESYRQGMWEGLRELFRFREVVYTLAWRDIRVRYKQAALGATWALLNPLVLMVLFSLVFGVVAGINPPRGVPYPIFSYTGLVPWALFAGSLTYGATAVVSNASIIRKVYCPREAFPLAATFGAGFDFLMSSVVLLGMLLFFGFYPSVTWVAALGLVLILYVLSVALTMLVSIITAFYRDTRYGVPLLVQVLLFATPVGYPLQRVLDSPGLSPLVKDLYVYANPLTPLMDGFRRTLLFDQWPETIPTLVSVAWAVGLMLIAYWTFKRFDAVISDVT
ncbi:MAG TPA: ABC transporter permease [Actinomycetota bacterium]|nr:ABC transporter permease [Actinomycetota bacterium]